MKLLDYDAEGATIHLQSRELLMVMALVQEGRCSFECDGHIGSALDELFSTAVARVISAARDNELGVAANDSEFAAYEEARLAQLQ